MTDALSGISEVDLSALGRTYFSVLLRDSKNIEIEFCLKGQPTEDDGANQKAGVLSIQWLDRNGSEVDAPVSGYMKSQKYGIFRYLAFADVSGEAHFSISLRAPPDASLAVARIWKFANPTLTLDALSVKRVD